MISNIRCTRSITFHFKCQHISCTHVSVAAAAAGVLYVCCTCSCGGYGGTKTAAAAAAIIIFLHRAIMYQIGIGAFSQDMNKL